MRNSKMAKVRGTAVKLPDKTNKSGSKKLSPIKTKKDIATKSSDKVSSTSKLNKTSKTISKTSKTIVTKIIKKKVKEVSWLKNLLESSEQTKKRVQKIPGISVQHPASIIDLRFEHGVNYAMFPAEPKSWCGFAKMGPRTSKPMSRSKSTVHLTVLVGKVQLSVDKCEKNFECGSMITIPKGVRYGLKNLNSSESFLRIQSIFG